MVYVTQCSLVADFNAMGAITINEDRYFMDASSTRQVRYERYLEMVEQGLITAAVV